MLQVPRETKRKIGTEVRRLLCATVCVGLKENIAGSNYTRRCSSRCHCFPTLLQIDKVPSSRHEADPTNTRLYVCMYVCSSEVAVRKSSRQARRGETIVAVAVTVLSCGHIKYISCYRRSSQETTFRRLNIVCSSTILYQPAVAQTVSTTMIATKAILYSSVLHITIFMYSPVPGLP